jgi:hypothetical protein
MLTPIKMLSGTPGGVNLEDFGFSRSEIGRANAALISTASAAIVVTFDGSQASGSNGHTLEGGKLHLLGEQFPVGGLNVYSTAAVTITLLI